MIELGELVMILDLHRQGLSVTAIARQLAIDRKIVRKYIARGLAAPAYGPRQPRTRLIGAFVERIAGSADVLPRERVGDAGTAQRWAARIEELIGSALAKSLRPRAAAFAREQWSWDTCVARYAALLRACIQ